MKLSAEAVKELQMLLCEEYGQEISYADAEKVGQNLINMFILCLKK